jgi:hypothetical protein
VEVRHINRSSSATHQPKVDTGAKSEYEISVAQGCVAANCSNRTAAVQQRHVKIDARTYRVDLSQTNYRRFNLGALRLLTARQRQRGDR